MSNDQHIPSRHKCLIYEGAPSNQLPVVVPLLKEGLHDHWRCLYLGSPEMVQMMDTALQIQGIDTAQKSKEQALILSSDRSHLINGKFDPNAMLDGLEAAIDQAIKDGFVGLCATGDMRWELGDDDKNFETLIDYERKLEEIFHRKSLMGICQYHRDIVPEAAIKGALLTHRDAYIGDVLNQNNIFYLPPEMNQLDGSKQADWMSSQIVRVLKAERTRDIALQELSLANLDLEKRVQARTTELQAANKELESFSYSISHDLRAPVRAIHGFGNILSQDATELLPEHQHYLDRILKSATHMEHLIDDLLSMSRVARSQMKKVRVDLTAMSTDIIEDLRNNSPGRAVEVEIQPNLWVQADPTLLRAVMINLIGNAWKFTGKTAQARIVIGCKEDVFSVQDNGAGFDMAYAGKMFAPFHRLHTAEEFEGTGVGLSIVEKIITRHGGKVWAEGVRDQGATLYFTLPA